MAIKIIGKCPACGQNRVKAEKSIILKGDIAGFYCENCGAKFDTEIYHAWENKRHFYIALHRNPKYWEMDNSTLEEGIEILEQRNKEGIKQYLHKTIMAEILPQEETN